VLLNVKQPTAARQNVMMSDWTDGKDALRSEQRKKELYVQRTVTLLLTRLTCQLQLEKKQA